MSVITELESAFADYFRDPSAVDDSPLAFQLENNAAVVEALRSVFQGPGGLVRLRLWCLLTLVQQGSAFLSREALDQLFYALRPEALDSVVKRLREAGLLSWDETQRHYGLTALAQQVASMLSPLAQQPDDELSGLLGQVVGADRLGTLDGAQLQMLQAQLGRLHHEFADAIASGSEFRLRQARKRYDRASRLIDKASDTITAIIGNARGQLRLEQAARGLGQAQSRLLAMASQFNRALQQVDRQRHARDDAEQHVVNTHEHRHRTKAPGDAVKTFGNVFSTQAWADGHLFDDFHGRGQRACPQQQGSIGGLHGRHAARDLYPSATNFRANDRRRDNLPPAFFKQQNGHALAHVFAGDIAKNPRALGI